MSLPTISAGLIALAEPAPKPQFRVEIEEVEEEIDLEEYTGPTADDLRREAEAFKASWDSEREKSFRSVQELVSQASRTFRKPWQRRSEQYPVVKIR